MMGPENYLGANGVDKARISELHLGSKLGQEGVTSRVKLQPGGVVS